MPNAKILRRAIRETGDVHSWLEQQHLGLGDRFLDRLGQFMNEIAENPYRFAIVWDRFRQGYEGQFRYYVYYTVGIEDQVFVHAVVHASRDQEAVVSSLIS